MAEPGAPMGVSSLIELARGVLRDLPALLGDRVELASLELQRAGGVLVKALALTVAAAVLGVTAWLAFWGLLVGVLLAAGWHWAAANGLVVLINLAAAAWAVQRVRHSLRLVALPATRKHLMFGAASAEPPPAGPAPHDDEPRPARPAAA